MSVLKGAAAVCALVAVCAAPAAADPTGLWLDKDGWTIRIQSCGPDLCAMIASVKRVRLKRKTPAVNTNNLKGNGGGIIEATNTESTS